MRADAAAGGRMPPVLDVAFAELPRRAQQQVLADERRLGVHQRHHVLQLVAEPERAPRLVEAAAAPEAARHGLVEEPAVGQRVERGVGRLDVDGAERVVPVLPDGFERAARGAPRPGRGRAGPPRRRGRGPRRA